jgi:hypothetical protein
MTERDLTNRAISAYYRAADGGAVNQPSSQVVTIDGLTYVHLFNLGGTLAVYRVRTVGGVSVLKGLKRWPKELRDEVTA